MSKVRFAAVAAVIAGVCVVRGAYAQDLDRLRVRADSLAAAWSEARMLADLQDSLKRNAPPPNMERAQAGALTVLADPSRLPLDQAAQAAWAQLDTFYGSAAAALAGRPIVLRILTLRQAQAPGRGERWVLASDDLDVADLTQLLVRNAPLPRADAALHEWLATPLLPPGDVRRERAMVYVDLVTALASVSRRCFGGDLTACRLAIGLTPAARPMLDWWTADDRRRLVPALLGDYYLDNPERRPIANACLEQNADSACVRLLESIPRASLPRPLGPAARLSLAQLALERGGRGAYTRLLADSTAPMADRLGMASGLSPDSLVAVWHQAIAASRPSRVVLPWLSALIVIGWIGVFATCALRSTRWRI